MEKSVERLIDKARKLLDKNYLERAEQLVTRGLEQHANDTDLLSIDIYIALKYKTWQKALARIIYALRFAPIRVLFQDEGIRALFGCFIHEPAFRTALFEYLLNHQFYSEIYFILCKATESECEELIEIWIKASEGVSDPIASGNWYIALGIGHCKKGNTNSFQNAWKKAVKKVHSSLPGLIAFCRRENLLNLNTIEDRLFLIELFLLSDSIQKGLTLMKLMGQESADLAKAVLKKFHSFPLPAEYLSEFTILKTNLALLAEDTSYLKTLQGEWSSLNSEQLFNIQKAISIGVKERSERRELLLHVVEAFFSNQDWESSAHLLETMYREEKDSEIIAMMEHLLDRYPIMPHLHLKVGDFQLNKGLIAQALKHFSMVKDVPEYNRIIQVKLENLASSHLERELVETLFDFYSSESDKIPLFGINAYLNNKGSEWLANCVLERLPGVGLSPFWFMFLIQHHFKQSDHHNALNYTIRFIETHPEVAYETIPLIEKHMEQLKDSVIPVITAINRNIEKLACRNAWKLIESQLERASTISQNAERTEFFSMLHKAEDLFKKGEIVIGLQLLQRMAQQFEDAVEDVLKFIDSLKVDDPFLKDWIETKLSILLRNDRYEELLQFAKPVLLDIRFRAHISTIHQYIGWSYQAIGNVRDAIEHFCYGSLDKKWYKKNLPFFKEHIFRGHSNMIPNVLSLIQQNGDEKGAQEFLELWYEFRPGDLNKIIAFQEEFSKEHVSPASQAQMVLWVAENEEFTKAREMLKSFDPRIQEYGDYLPRIVQIFKLRQPNDPTARFLMGRYYLFQKQTGKAINIFRNLIQDLPHTLEDVYIYMKKFLKKHIAESEPELIFGLLIRIALDQKLFSEAVDLLREFAKWDHKAAASFLDGVYKVMKTGDVDKKVLFDFLKLNAEWHDYKRVCEIEEQGLLGSEMLQERLEWLVIASKNPSLRSRSLALRAKMLFNEQRFEDCIKLVFLVMDNVYATEKHAELLEMGLMLIHRFPKNIDLKRVVAFSCWKHGLFSEARPLFEHLLLSDKFSFRIEAFAILKEMGVDPSFSVLVKDHAKNKDQVLAQLNAVYHRVRQFQFEMMDAGEYEADENIFFWLLDQERLLEYRKLLDDAKQHFNQQQVNLLRAYYLRKKGKINQAAFSLLREPCPPEIKKMFFMEAGLWEQALLIEDSSVTDVVLRKYIWAMQRQHKLAVSHLSHLSNKISQ
ncbi:MAG: hypothetical protein CSA81_03285 [Acidobacteria bacterium]|nr:MAG: hypothetical protein CSA81_03285 [Acidobacteriota bacterium]